MEIVEIPELHLQKWKTNLQTAVLANRACLFVARRIQDYQKSRLGIVTDILSVLILLIFTITTFSFANLAAFKLDNSSFSYSFSPTLFDFVYYSFHNILFDTVSSLEPIGQLPRILVIL